ncbi:hypothetical protein GOB87_14465 [Acetobacter estunensis]|uniref:Uncharacterized protein n=1 Tax=Acetobacter estunensis TaxID=104097 RepID=A0A967ECY5_9PROT|nr:hypothetical protein [Acetobacter estunensis]NHO55133.1 hypothetical protein [Acetobacter estunensis]
MDGSVLKHDTNNEQVGLLGPYTGQGHIYVLLAESAGSYTGRPSAGSPKISGTTIVFGDGKFAPAR